MRTLQIMLALLKKNNSQTGVYVSLLVLLGTALFGIAFGEGVLPDPAAGGMFFWLFILATAAGAGAFSIDLKLNHIRFLEYLPVRRWHMWLANWGDGLAWLWAMVIASALPHALAWTPDLYADGFSPMRDARLHHILFGTRWTLLIGLLGLTFCAFSVGAFYRVMVERDTAAIFRASISSIVVCGAVLVLPPVLEIYPTLLDAAVVWFVVGVVFSAGSLVMFVSDRRYWGWIRRWFALRIPCFVVVHVLGLIIFGVACLSWVKLTPDEPFVNLRVRYDPAHPDEPLLLSAHAMRSGRHLFTLDPRSGARHYIGRGIDVPRGGSWPFRLDGRLLLEANFAPDGFTKIGPRLLSVSSDGSDRRTVLDSLTFVDTDGRGTARNISSFATSGDGKAIVFTSWLDARSESAAPNATLFVADTRGTIRASVPIDVRADMAVRGNRAVARPPYDDDGVDRDAAADTSTTKLICIDLPTGDARTIELPGQLLGCNGDLSAALCLQTRDADDKQYRSLVLHDLTTRVTTVIAGEDEIPTAQFRTPAYSMTSRDYGNLVDRSTADGGGGMEASGVRAVFDPSGRRIAWFVMPDEDALGPPGVTLVELPALHKRIILDASDVKRMRRPASRPASRRTQRAPEPFYVWGFTRDGDALVYAWENEVVAVDTAPSDTAPVGTRRRRVLASTALSGKDENENVFAQLSPSRKRAVVVRTRYDRRGPVHLAHWTVELTDAKRAAAPPAEIYAGTRQVEVRWLDDERLILDDDRTITIVNVVDGSRRVVFGGDRGNGIGNANDKYADAAAPGPPSK